MTKKLKRGTIIYGFAGGLFGRDSYSDKMVVESGYYGDVPWAILAHRGTIDYKTYEQGSILSFLYGHEDTKYAKKHCEPVPVDDEGYPL